MIEILYEFAESAVSIENAFITLFISLIISVGIGFLARSIKKSISFQLLTALIFQLVVIILFFSLRDNVKKYRYEKIESTMSQLSFDSQSCDNVGVHISNWRTGLKHIAKCPTEIGYYIKTADLLAADKDYESAATLIEFGLDFLGTSPPPQPLCERLQKYYRHLKNRPSLSENCTKFHEL